MPKHIADLLNKAAEIIETRGFVKGDDKNAKMGHAGCPTCAALALYDAGEALNLSRRDVWDARRALCRHVGIANEDFLFGVFQWNDAPERTGEEVIAGLRGAAEKELAA